MIRLLSSGQFALPIKHITTDGKLSKHAGDPLAELGGKNDVHAIAHANDSVEIVELKCSIDISISFASNYRDFLGSCLFFEFFALIDVLQMKPNVICRTIDLAIISVKNHNSAESRIMVTGPSFRKSTFISAPKRPVSTCRLYCVRKT